MIESELIIWREDNRLVAAMLPELSDRIEIKGRLFKVTGSLGDYDLLRSDQNELVGISFCSTKQELEDLDYLISGVDAVVESLPSVLFLLAKCAQPKIEHVQGSTWIYTAQDRSIAVGIHKWVDWGSIAFSLIDDAVGVPNK